MAKQNHACVCTLIIIYAFVQITKIRRKKNKARGRPKLTIIFHVLTIKHDKKKRNNQFYCAFIWNRLDKMKRMFAFNSRKLNSIGFVIKVMRLSHIALNYALAIYKISWGICGGILSGTLFEFMNFTCNAVIYFYWIFKMFLPSTLSQWYISNIWTNKFCVPNHFSTTVLTKAHPIYLHERNFNFHLRVTTVTLAEIWIWIKDCLGQRLFTKNEMYDYEVVHMIQYIDISSYLNDISYHFQSNLRQYSDEVPFILHWRSINAVPSIGVSTSKFPSKRLIYKIFYSIL